MNTRNCRPGKASCVRRKQQVIYAKHRKTKELYTTIGMQSSAMHILQNCGLTARRRAQKQHPYNCTGAGREGAHGQACLADIGAARQHHMLQLAQAPERQDALVGDL